MATDRFSKSEAIKFGWNTMKANFGFFIGIMIVVFAIGSPFDIALLKTPWGSIQYFVIYIICNVVSSMMGLGLIRISLKFCDGQKCKFIDLFSWFNLIFKYLGASILYWLICLGGTILLIIPGIIWGIRFQYYAYFIVDKGMGPIKALKASSAITKGVKWDLFLFGLLLFCINLLGFICLVIGLFVTLPTTHMALAFVYRKLESQLQINQTPIRDIART